jgi:outer membrane protein OmpA-like peptidoglycan-associated protein
MRKLLLILVVFALSGSVALAQEAGKKKSYNKLSVTVHGGLTTFYGDVQQYTWWPVKDFRSERGSYGIGGNIAWQFNPVWGVNINLMGATLKGTKRHGANSASTNNWVYFDNEMFEYTANGVLNFMNLIYRDKTKQRKFKYYFSFGVGFSSFRALKKKLGSDTFAGSVGYTNAGTETKERTTETVFPLAFGVKYRISRKFDLGLETSMRWTASDKFDATRGNTGVNDKYGYTNLSLTYKIGKNEDSQEWVNPFEALNKNLDDIQSNIDGLAKDADGDGVSDLFDKEPNTPAGVAVDGSGRSLDVDSDGVPDHMDSDPFSTKGAKVDESGKEVDSDNDGVADGSDIEPNTKPGAMVNFQGKTIEVSPSETTSSTTNISGGILLPSVYFKVNSPVINYWSSYDALATVAKALKANSGLKLTVVGHADKTASEQFNKDLAQKRADAVVKHLVDTYKIDAGRLTAVSKGETESLVPTADNVENNVNRRVDFEVK